MMMMIRRSYDYLLQLYLVAGLPYVEADRLARELAER